jgi:hypothetical protein
MAQNALGEVLGVEPDAVRVTSIDEIDFPDGCLGLPEMFHGCSEAIVPGFTGYAQVDGVEYEYRISREGTIFRYRSLETWIVWGGEVEGACRTATFGYESAQFEACGEEPWAAVLINQERASAVRYFVGKYLPFEAETPAGSVRLAGQGEVTATPAEQRMIAEWAHRVAQEAQFGSDRVPFGLVLDWQRVGGIAGFCDGLSVFRSGEAMASSCKNEGNPQRVWLNAAQLEMLYAWLDEYAPAELHIGDGAVADGMDEDLVFEGIGATTMDDYTLQEMLDFAQGLYAEATLQASDADLQAGYAALTRYLEALAEGRYADAAEMYGGDYEILQSWNPGMDPNDGAALFEAGCTFNGLVCNLGIHTLVDEAQVGADEFRYIVELETPDGELFVLGPCCGADPEESPPITQFSFQVERNQGRFSVVDLPVYVP